MKLLSIDSSITGDNSISRQLVTQTVDRLLAQDKNIQVTRYNLAQNPIPHLSGELFAAQGKTADTRTQQEQENVGLSETIMADFQSADILVIGAPMYNFSVPSQLKAWIDRINVAGKTFRYTENGPQGLSGGKRVIIVSVRGGKYGEDSGLAALDHQESYLKTVFGFLGITDIEIIRAEGVNMKDNAAPSIAAAKAHIATLSHAPLMAQA